MNRIAGIAYIEMERIHWYLGPGKGSTCAYKHLPSGITASGKVPPDGDVLEFDKQLLTELTQKLTAAGIIPAADA
jgi:hypothetical protein